MIPLIAKASGVIRYLFVNVLSENKGAVFALDLISNITHSQWIAPDSEDQGHQPF